MAANNEPSLLFRGGTNHKVGRTQQGKQKTEQKFATIDGEIDKTEVVAAAEDATVKTINGAQTQCITLLQYAAGTLTRDYEYYCYSNGVTKASTKIT